MGSQEDGSLLSARSRRIASDEQGRTTGPVAAPVGQVREFIRTVVLAGALGLGTRLFDAYSVGNNVLNIAFDLVI